MKTLDELYQQMLKRAADGKPIGVEGEPRLIDCLAHPDDHPLVWRVKPCLCPPDEPHSCEEACDWGAIKRGPEGVEVDDSQCVGCQACV
ncbi:MAG: iron hydrogenase, partial [Megasphaera sp.]|nr:iron hydrogenase [Megasphaera sp.]